MLVVRFFKNTVGYFQVLTQEKGTIKNPLDSNYQKKSGTIHANLGCIVEQTVKYKRNKHT